MDQGRLESREVGKKTAFGRLTPKQQGAVNAANDVLRKTHNFYSGFSVGAALVVPENNGTFIAGTNFENAAYGSTICAERAAVLRANAEGHRNFEGIAIVARNRDQNAAMAKPCGSCRQVLWELAGLCNRDLYVVLSTEDESTFILSTIGELLPLAFGPNSIRSETGDFHEIDEYREKWAKAGGTS